MAETNSTVKAVITPIKPKLSPQQKCELKGGRWDGSKCIMLSVPDFVPPEEITRETGTNYNPTLAGRQQAEAQAKAKAERERLQAAQAEAKARAGQQVGEFTGSPIDINQVTTQEAPTEDVEKKPYNQVIFNKDKTITVIKGDVTETLTKEEYDVLLGKSGMITDKVKALRAVPTQQQAVLQQQAGQIGQVGGLAPVTEAPINFSQAITAGLAGSAAGIAGGAALGLATGGAFSIPLAAAGAVAGLVTGIISNIKVQQSGELKSAKIELTNARTNMRQLAMLASQDPANADVYISQYNKQLTRVYQARRQTKVEVQGDLNAWIEDGREQLADFDLFLLEGGTADIYGQKLKSSLQTGVPLSIQGELLL